jgi:hypothetical protein
MVAVNSSAGASHPAASSLPAVRCVLISGYGKSGSKRLLRLFDLSPETHCRNEPYNYMDSPFHALRQAPGSWVVCRGDNEAIASRWREAVKWTASHIGDRDQFPPPHKFYATPVARLAWRVIGSRRCRKALWFVAPGWRREEWIPPAWLYDANRMRAAVTVLKLNLAPQLTTWALLNDPTTRVVHLLRHPGAVLHSWRKRLLTVSDREKVTRDNRDRLRFVAEQEPHWRHRFGSIEQMSAEEAELWYWCYLNEAIHEIGVNHPSYTVVFDEHIAHDAPAAVSAAMQFCGLTVSQAMIDVMTDVAGEWRKQLCHWRQLLDNDHVALIDRVLADSSLRQCWAPNELVSRIDYKWMQLGL